MRTDAERAAALVAAHGSDTLAFFKLRPDLDLHFSRDGRAFAGYRVHGGVLMVAADPVGPADALPALVDEVAQVARSRRLRLAVFAASDAGRDLFAARAGLRPLYLGEEAVVDAARFSLVGRPIRKVRQAVARVERAGYSVAIDRLGSLGDEAVGELEALAERARYGEPEHGFAMEFDSLRGGVLADTLVVVARDGDGAARGILHFVPCPGREAWSLSMMRRDRETPNGLGEYLIVRAIEALREQGASEVSLNFATFARWIREPASRAEHVLGRVVRQGDRWFQIESLYKFNAKFFPRWEPRHLLFEGRFGLPRAGLAALWAEGLIPEPRLARRRAR